MASRTAEDAAERSRRRFARRQWRRRWLVWRRVVAALGVVALGAAVVWLVWFSAWLAVGEVEVRGTEVLAADDVRAATGLETGEPLVSLDLPKIEARVEALAAVGSAEVTRQWPDRVLVTVRERRAIAVVEVAGRLRGMAADGVLFRSYRRAPQGLPRVETVGPVDAEALTESAQVVAALPAELRVRVARIRVGTVDRIELVLRDGRLVVWGSAEDSEQKATVLAALLRQRAPVYDVSVPARPSTRPR